MLKILSLWIKRALIVIWIILFVSIFSYYLYNPLFFGAESLKQFLEQFGSALLFVYFLLSALRGFTLIPSTPFVLV